MRDDGGDPGKNGAWSSRSCPEPLTAPELRLARSSADC